VFSLARLPVLQVPVGSKQVNIDVLLAKSLVERKVEKHLRLAGRYMNDS
jgi:hypothetical protein